MLKVDFNMIKVELSFILLQQDRVYFLKGKLLAFSNFKHFQGNIFKLLYKFVGIL